MHTRLKICGVTQLDDALRLAKIGVELLGFNFYADSPRYIDPLRAGSIISRLQGQSICVGILVRPTLQQAREIVRLTGVSMLQIYEPVDFQDYHDLPVAVIDSHRWNASGRPPAPRPGARYLLLDRYHPQKPGGTGMPLQWHRIPRSFPRETLVLAGGIHPGNIRRALEQVHPAIIDVASGAEVQPGQKDFRKVLPLQLAITAFNLTQKQNTLSRQHRTSTQSPPNGKNP